MASDDERDSLYSLRLMREQHELIKQLERDLLMSDCTVSLLRRKLNMYKDKIIKLEMTPGEKLVRRLIEGKNYAAANSNR